MPATVVQNLEGAQNTGLATNTVAHSAAVAGNTLILVVGSDDYRTTAGASRPESSGYALVTGGSQETFLGHYVWVKVAAGGETSVQYTIGSAATSCWEFYEVSGLDTSSPVDISNGQLAASAANSYTTPSITPTAGERWLFASMGGSLSAALTGMGTWLNSFVELNDTVTTLASGTRDIIGAASRTVTADGVTSYSSGATYDATSPQSRTGIIVAFKMAGAATGDGGPGYVPPLSWPGDGPNMVSRFVDGVQWMSTDDVAVTVSAVAVTGYASAAATASATTVKASAVTGSCRAAATASATAVHRATITARSSAAAVAAAAITTGAARPVTGAATATATATAAVVHRTPATGASAATAAASATAVHRLTATASAAATATASAAAVHRLTATGSAPATGTARAAAVHRLTATGSAAATATVTATTVHRVAVTGSAPAVATARSTFGALPRAVTGSSAAVGATSAAAVHRATPTGSAAATGSARAAVTRRTVAVASSAVVGTARAASARRTAATGGGAAVATARASSARRTAVLARCPAVATATAAVSQLGAQRAAVGRSSAIGTPRARARFRILRPNIGTTIRPDTGTTTRPDTGTTARPASGVTLRPFTGITERP